MRNRACTSCAPTRCRRWSRAPRPSRGSGAPSPRTTPSRSGSANPYSYEVDDVAKRRRCDWSTKYMVGNYIDLDAQQLPKILTEPRQNPQGIGSGYLVEIDK